ncbi:MAG: methyltransferase [Deltaproteobacteria bacterium]|nr:methyltransferase [Deltaproteobacteria bacterium]
MNRDLDLRLADPGYTPARGELDELLTRVKDGDELVCDRAEKAIARLGGHAIEGVLAALEASVPPARARLVRLAGRVARGLPIEDQVPLRRALFARLADEDDVARRQAIVALGRLGGDDVVEALGARVAREARVEHHRALAEALGKSHSPRARAAVEELRALAASHRDVRLDRILAEADLMLRRGEARDAASAVVPGRRTDRPVEVWFHARRGLERFVVEELRERRIEAHPLIPGVVRATWRGELGELFLPRVATRFGFPLPQASVKSSGGLEEAVAMALASEASLTLLRAFTEGVVRYRLEWTDAGRRRGGSMRAAELAAARCAELVNDPRAPTWEVVVHDRGPVVQLELWPRGLDDPRFTYRHALLPAGSHPTVAAALARASRVTDDDVVWDPFVGSATELIECARLAPLAKLHGCDLDEGALDAARQNLAAAGVSAALTRMDARAFRPPTRPSLIVSNPPMGRRIADLESLVPVFEKVVARAAEWLPERGRLVWLSPLPRETERDARRHGLVVTGRRDVDMGGFFAELQRIERGAR